MFVSLFEVDLELIILVNIDFKPRAKGETAQAES